jgi:hypothetical protein
MMLAAAHAFGGADGVAETVAGIGMLLLFAGVLVRTLATRLRGGEPQPPHRDARCENAVVAMAAESVHVAPMRRGSGAYPIANWRPPLREHRPADRLASTADAGEPEHRRFANASLAPLGRTIDASRRRRAADDRIAVELAGLPDGFWLVERDLLIGNRRLPFLVLGATGVFAIRPADGPWTLDELAVMAALGERVRAQLPGYAGPVHVAVCLAFEHARPRIWFAGESHQGRGGWLLGVDSLLPWMFGFGPEHGLRVGDVRRLHQVAGPSWERCRSARMPAAVRLG